MNNLLAMENFDAFRGADGEPENGGKRHRFVPIAARGACIMTIHIERPMMPGQAAVDEFQQVILTRALVDA
ncbi:hypothetical protein L8957_27220, partial [Klebsiella pneumoniae]|nr:hypothetical protein [Klebsiella pneumoniae]